MLKNINTLLTPELLYVLQSMGHGDEIVLCDANFPAYSIAAETVYGEVIRLDGADAPSVAKAILSVMPLDTFVKDAAFGMEVVGNPDEVPEVQRLVQKEIDEAEPNFRLAPIERMAFYERSKKAYAVVASSERRLYGCFIFKKGVVPPK
ncbi:MAG: RbsD/FucU family protein [Alphaproteobacteria bacterium]